MWPWAGEAPTIPDDPSTAIVLAIVAALSGALGLAITGMFQLLTARANRTSSSPPAPEPVAQTGNHGERIAVLEHRADETDDSVDIIDRRVDHLEVMIERILGGREDGGT